MKAPSSPSEIQSALIELIDGETVKRSKFILHEDQTDYTDLFKSLLHAKNFFPRNLASIDLMIGFRLPSFYIDEKISTVFFGWVLWEKFHYLNHRKIWASEQRELNGDWSIYFEEKDQQQVWVNETQPVAMEMENLIS